MHASCDNYEGKLNTSLYLFNRVFTFIAIYSFEHYVHKYRFNTEQVKYFQELLKTRTIYSS